MSAVSDIGPNVRIMTFGRPSRLDGIGHPRRRDKVAVIEQPEFAAVHRRRLPPTSRTAIMVACVFRFHGFLDFFAASASRIISSSMYAASDR
jgi:hypothetical protein